MDFGTAFTVTDTDGEPPASPQNENVILDESAKSGPVVVVKALEDHGRHGLETNDIVTFSRLRGISENLIQNDIIHRYWPVHAPNETEREVRYDCFRQRER